MVPVSLQLSNFLSYGQDTPPLDFSLFHTACLSGNNGNGKSAILDGLTWAMWGEARHTTASLLRLGASEMRVEFELDLSGERYRIVRGHAKNKRSGTGTLELAVLDPQSGLYRPLTRPSMRDTQAQIDALLRMNYDTFIASAYLKQGQADKFTRQPPAQRKQVLSDILGLSRYQEIADRARADARVEDAKVAEKEAQIEGIENFLAGRAEAQRQFDFYNNALQEMRPQIEALQTRVEEQNARKIRLEEKRKRSENIAHELDAEERKRAELQSARGRLLAQKNEIVEWQAQSDAIVQEFEAFRASKNTLEKWNAVKESYDALGEAYRKLKDKIQLASENLQRRRHELETQAAHETRVIADNESQVTRAAEIAAGAQELEEAREAETMWAQKRAAHDEATDALRAAENAIRARANALELELHKIEAQLAEAQAQAARLPQARELVESAESQLKKLEEANEKLNDLHDERNAHQARVEQLKASVENERSQIAANEQKLKVLQANPQAQCPLCETALGDHGREHIQENIEDEIALAQSRIEDFTAEARLEQKKKTALDAPLAEMQKLLRDAPRLNASAANARLQLNQAQEAERNSGVLLAEQKRVAELLESGEYAPQESKALNAARSNLAEIFYDAAAHAQIAQRVSALAKFEREIAALRFAQEQIAGAQKRLAEIEPQLASVNAELQSGDYAREETIELARLKAQADKLNYDREAKAAHAQARSDFARLEKAPLRYDRWQNIVARADEVAAELARSDKASAELEEKIANLRREQSALSDVALQIAECERTLSIAQNELRESRELERQSSAELGRQRGILEACAMRENERVKLDDERKSAAREAFILKQTAQAFGKDGIQALIIENAIPELQDEANAILRRLTRNHMQISIESLREKQTGGLKETLDIKISDDRGTREYLLYSGGEAFRADFAIRIALSKLLARRAGTQLRTLIIDEGFGTQDAEGLQQMIECIQTISDDFQKVLVVTHLDVIKNAFPTRIEVSKEPDTGSRFQILQG